MGAQDWLCSVAIQEPDDKRAYDYVRQWFWDNRIELPVSNRIDRIISSALTSFEDQLFQGISTALSDHGKQAIDEWRFLKPLVSFLAVFSPFGVAL